MHSFCSAIKIIWYAIDTKSNGRARRITYSLVQDVLVKKDLPSTRRDCRSYRTVRPSVWTRDLDRAFTNVYVLSYGCAHGRFHTAAPGVHPTSTSRDVSDQVFPSLSNFYCVLRCACGGRPGNQATMCMYLRNAECNVNHVLRVYTYATKNVK